MERSIRVWVEGTLMASLAMVLSLIPLDIGSSFSISLGQIPLTIFALRRGWKPGIFAGLVWGLLHFPMGKVWFLSVLQVLIEYPFAFTFIGFAGIYAARLQKAVKNKEDKKVTSLLLQATFVGVLARYIWHFIAGWVYWGQYALWGMKPWLFSLVMNGASAIATGIVTAVFLLIIYRVYPIIFIPKGQAMKDL